MSEKGELRETKQSGWIERLLAQFPPGQFGRYLVVGLFNSAFGYGTYAGLTALFTPHIPFAYMLASLVSAFSTSRSRSSPTSGSSSRQRQLPKEWSECFVVYGGTNALGAFLPFIVFTLRHSDIGRPIRSLRRGCNYDGRNSRSLGFLGHKNFSFAPNAKPKPARLFNAVVLYLTASIRPLGSENSTRNMPGKSGNNDSKAALSADQARTRITHACHVRLPE